MSFGCDVMVSSKSSDTRTHTHHLPSVSWLDYISQQPFVTRVPPYHSIAVMLGICISLQHTASLLLPFHSGVKVRRSGTASW